VNVYPVNELVQMSVTFATAEGALPVDPSDVTLTLTPPDCDAPVVLDYAQGQITRAGVGEYYAQYVLSVGGLWIYRWQGTGAVIASSGNGFMRAV
jgi:hypothetical protein